MLLENYINNGCKLSWYEIDRFATFSTIIKSPFNLHVDFFSPLDMNFHVFKGRQQENPYKR